MIISRYFFREILHTLLALTTLLLLIYISHRFMMYLVEASVGALPADFIFQLLVLKLLSDLMLLLPLGFFLALLLALGRMYKDNEITAMAACGIRVPVLTIVSFGVGFALIIGTLSLFLAPWAESQSANLQRKLSTIAEVGGIAAGRFKEFSHGKGIFYVETIDTNNNTMYTLFMQLNLPHKQVIMVAKQGHQVVQEGELFMVLVDGHRYESTPGHLDYIVTKFAEHRLKIPKRIDAPSSNKKHEAIPSISLWYSQENSLKAELQWRLSLPLTVILLALLAVPLSHTTPRQGQYAKILIGILIYLIYNNMLNVAKKWVERGDVVPWIGVWWVHIALLIIIGILFHFSFLKKIAFKWLRIAYLQHFIAQILSKMAQILNRNTKSVMVKQMLKQGYAKVNINKLMNKNL
ncbi:LPS export ABC transporter permease LptF [Candidatus Parabeggiatoa sp. HSG14]|uniref:LPS export ABC transporter permease LptF n=1 Tax=Candidatus Parabeggiatoa sp. HSG14 TaxID=3055593 RepID=UPI0025A76393|nr:LPS export ABC transporter permease LptF [Thiotrichales bacterium HSG14]